MNDAPATAPDGAAPATAGARTVVGNRIDFSAQLDSFQGPLDLLLYLIKENEVEVTEIPISLILEQYLRFLDNADQWDLQLAGEFLVMAATLMEIKSRDLLPVQEQPTEGEEIIEDPRSELVRQLLQYRRLKEQARALEQLQDTWTEMRPRGFFGDVPDPSDEENPEADRATARDALIDVDIYGLFAAYERILKSVLAQTPRNIIFDGETLEDKIVRIEKLLKTRPFASFAELVVDPGNRADIAATFVALLELVRRRAVRLVQANDFGMLEIKTQTEGEVDALSREESANAEAHADATLKAKAEQDALLAQGADQGEGVDKLPWSKRRQPARPKFEGILRPEDVEEIDAEEHEIGRRIDAILAAADAISERFEQSREGRVRGDEVPPDGAPAVPPEGSAAPAQESPPEGSAAPAQENPPEPAADAVEKSEAKPNEEPAAPAESEPAPPQT